MAPIADTAFYERVRLAAGVTLALVATLALIWLAHASLLVIFAGILVAVALHACAMFLVHHVGGPRLLHLGAVVLVASLAVIGLLTWGGATIVQQAGEFATVFDEQVGRLLQALGQFGISFDPQAGGFDLRRVLPDLGALAGGATEAIFSFFGVLGSALIILFLGVFFAAEPHVYRKGLVNLTPRGSRDRIRTVLDRSARSLRSWMLGQAASMLAVFVLAYALLWLIGMPYALLLALISGLLEFIPTLGPTIAGVIIVLGGLSQGWEMAVWGLGAYVVMQVVESNLLQPVLQERVARLPAAFNLSFQLVMGALFGTLGIALAVPLAAAGKVFLDELYVRDVLGGPAEEEDDKT